MPSYVSNLLMNGFEVKNFLIDKLSAAQISAIASPADGRPVYDTTNNQFLFRQNGAWAPLGLSGTLPLSQLTDDNSNADWPLLSGGGAGDPHYGQIDLATGAGLTGRLPLSRFVQTGISGQALLSAGNAADAAYGAINLAGGSNIVTGKLPLANVTTGATVGQPLLAGATDPAYGALDLTNANAISGRLPLANFKDGATAGYPLLAGGTGVDSAYGQLDLGGAGVTGTLPLAKLTDGATAGVPLLAGGGAGDPAYGALDLAQATAIQNRLPLANFAVGTSGYPLLGNGAGSSAYGQVDLAVGVTGTLQSSQMPTLTGDVSNSGFTVTVNSVDAATYPNNTAANIADAVSKRHTQNTDTGTTSATFQLDSGNSGVKLKSAAGEGQVRNAADTAFADLRVRNLVVEGTQTIVNSATVSVADNRIEVAGEIGDPAANTNGGIELRRLGAKSAALTGTVDTTAGSTTVTGTGTLFTTELAVGDGIILDDGNAGQVARRVVAIASDTSLTVDVVLPAALTGVTIKHATPDNVWVEFNVSTSRWQANFGAVGSTQTQADIVLRKAQNCGAGTSTTVTHNFGTKDVMVAVYDTATNQQVIADVTVALNSVTVDFGSAVNAGDYRIVVMG